MNIRIKLAAAAAFTLAASACGSQPHAAPPTPAGGGNFLPAYLAMLQGKQPFPADTCQAHDLHDLLVPCDAP